MPEVGPSGEQRRVERPRQIVLTDDGPILVSGPVEIVMPDGSRVRSDRPVTALCVCKRSRRQPFCDTSHRSRVRIADLGHDVTPEEDRAQPRSAATR
ncbi:MAG: CDGSH iron-sulfur domain-containing protein [Actinomycetota bacterium]|nr:CDGSH iron-sulfur domain-containing protein [Actinomycetota bacterium]